MGKWGSIWLIYQKIKNKKLNFFRLNGFELDSDGYCTFKIYEEGTF